VLADHVKCVDLRARHANFVEVGPPEVLENVRYYIALIIAAK
jgi:hypothetical protein